MIVFEYAQIIIVPISINNVPKTNGKSNFCLKNRYPIIPIRIIPNADHTEYAKAIFIYFNDNDKK
ncbi:hypothetical protein fsci_01110 [Francisella sciaenopsi]|uniref:Uncharacterized protein n=1 Tax=Francisella sciaenopsi TaxID=3055034 RepID=A0ABQ6PC61_9GAMM